jgi:hypothetical protein
MKTNPHRLKPEGKNVIPLKLTTEEAAFLDSECRRMSISRETYFEMLLDSPAEGEQSQVDAGISEHSHIISLLISEGWSIAFKPCRLGNRPGWFLQATRNKERHQVLTDELAGAYLRLLASTRHV